MAEKTDEPYVLVYYNSQGIDTFVVKSMKDAQRKYAEIILEWVEEIDMPDIEKTIRKLISGGNYQKAREFFEENHPKSEYFTLNSLLPEVFSDVLSDEELKAKALEE